MTLDLALLNATVHTGSHTRPRIGAAVGISNGRIVHIGPTEEIRALCRPETTIRNLDGMFLTPGFIDVHVHVLMAAEYLSAVGLRDARSMREVVERVAARAAATPDAPWIYGLEWSYGYPDLPGGVFDRAMLDAVSSDRPVLLVSAMAHAAWANSRALEIAGITAETPDPPNGEIVRRPDGSPSGWLKEHAVDLVRRHMPAAHEQDRRRGLDLAFQEAARCGVTRMQSAAFDESLLPMLHDLELSGKLPIRIGMMTEIAPPSMTEARLRDAVALRATYDTDMLRIDGLKFFLDGVLESHTGAMPDGYADRPDLAGALLWEREPYIDAVRRGMEAGFTTWTHAIGPGAIALSLDAIEAAGPLSHRLRPRVEHVELPYQADIDRFSRIGAIASMQPVMVAPSDVWMGMEGVWEARVGTRRLQNAFPMRALLDAGARLAFGTDWPIVPLDPKLGMRKAVLRRPLGAPADAGWVKRQAITFPEAFHAYTEGAAYAAGRDLDEGRIAEGAYADLTVLSANPFTVDPDVLPSLQNVLTIVGGRITHETL